MKNRRKNRAIPKRQQRALREAKQAEERLLDAYLCEDPYELARGAEPTLAEMMEAGEGQLPDR